MGARPTPSAPTRWPARRRSPTQPGRRGAAADRSRRPLRGRRCSPTRFRRSKPRRRFTGSARISRCFAAATANARKYILLVTNTQDVLIFDLEDKIRDGPFERERAQRIIAMKRNLFTLVIGAVLVVIFALLLFVFQVRQSEVAVVTTFGKPTRRIHASRARISNGRGRSRRSINSTSASRISRTSSTKTSRRTTSTCSRSVYVGWQISDAGGVSATVSGDGSVRAAPEPARKHAAQRQKRRRRQTSAVRFCERGPEGS